MSAAELRSSARYRFGESTQVGVLLGCSLRQAIPLVLGVLWLTGWMMIQLPLIGMAGPPVGVVAAFGRWRRAPLYEVATPGARLAVSRRRGHRTWVRASLLASGPVEIARDVPPALRGIELLDHEASWLAGRVRVAVVRDRPAGTVSLVLPVAAAGLSVASRAQQDALVAAWGGALSPLARSRCAVSRVTWQEWAYPVGLDTHRQLLAGRRKASSAAVSDYVELLGMQSPHTVAHRVLVTVTVEIRRVRARRKVSQFGAALEALVEESRLLAGRLEAAGATVGAPFDAAALAFELRTRSDPGRIGQLGALRRSLAAATGRGTIEFGPMAVEPDWFQVRVDGSWHRTFRVAGWPMLPVPADWLGPLLEVDAATRIVTVVMEPVPLGKAAADANRRLTSMEADQSQKERHGFRLTARERRRHGDVEARERELAEGHPEFRHVGLVTVTAASLDELDEAAARVEQAAAQSLLDLRPLAARQGEGWVASLPLGRSVKPGGWS